MLEKRTCMARLVAIMCVAACMSMAGSVLANDKGCAAEQSGRQQLHDFKKIAKRLGLTNAQQAQAQAMFQANKEVVKPIVTHLRTEQQSLQALLHADRIDEPAIRAATARIAGIQADLNVNKARVNAQFRALLTPEQLTALQGSKPKHHKKDSAPAGTPAPTDTTVPADTPAPAN